MKRSIGITFALFLLVGSIVDVKAEQKCTNVTEFIEFLAKNERAHTVVKHDRLDGFVSFFEQHGATFAQRPDYAVVVELPDRGITLLAFGLLDKVCDFYMLPAHRSRELMSGA